MKNILWTADLNLYPKSILKLSFRCKTHCAYSKETAGHCQEPKREKSKRWHNLTLCWQIPDIAGILFLNKHENKFYSWWNVNHCDLCAKQPNPSQTSSSVWGHRPAVMYRDRASALHAYNPKVTFIIPSTIAAPHEQTFGPQACNTQITYWVPLLTYSPKEYTSVLQRKCALQPLVMLIAPCDSCVCVMQWLVLFATPLKRRKSVGQAVIRLVTNLKTWYLSLGRDFWLPRDRRKPKITVAQKEVLETFYIDLIGSPAWILCHLSFKLWTAK